MSHWALCAPINSGLWSKKPKMCDLLSQTAQAHRSWSIRPNSDFQGTICRCTRWSGQSREPQAFKFLGFRPLKRRRCGRRDLEDRHATHNRAQSASSAGTQFLTDGVGWGDAHTRPLQEVVIQLKVGGFSQASRMSIAVSGCLTGHSVHPSTQDCGQKSPRCVTCCHKQHRPIGRGVSAQTLTFKGRYVDAQDGQGRAESPRHSDGVIVEPAWHPRPPLRPYLGPTCPLWQTSLNSSRVPLLPNQAKA